MSHGDQVQTRPRRLRAAGHDRHLPGRRGASTRTRPVYGLQFHPEVTPHAARRPRSCATSSTTSAAAAARGRWRRSSSRPIDAIREQRRQRPRHLRPVRRRRFVGRRGAARTRRSARRSSCIFVDNGLLRKGEAEAVVSDVPRPLQGRPARRRRRRAVPRRARRRHRPAGEADDASATSSSTCFKRRGQDDPGRAVPRPGHALPRRDRERRRPPTARRRRSSCTTTSAACRPSSASS